MLISIQLSSAQLSSIQPVQFSSVQQRCPDYAALRHFRPKIINAALTVDTCAQKTHHLYLNVLICLTLSPQRTSQLVINMLHNLHFTG